MSYLIWLLVGVLFFTPGGDFYAFMVLVSYYALMLSRGEDDVNS